MVLPTDNPMHNKCNRGDADDQYGSNDCQGQKEATGAVIDKLLCLKCLECRNDRSICGAAFALTRCNIKATIDQDLNKFTIKKAGSVGKKHVCCYGCTFDGISLGKKLTPLLQRWTRARDALNIDLHIFYGSVDFLKNKRDIPVVLEAEAVGI